MGRLDSITKMMLLKIREYEFDSFLIGAALPMQIYEREDTMRSRLKIRGRESIKNQLTRELGIRISKATKRKVDYLKPDLTISLAIDKENSPEINVKSRAITLFGRYTKKAAGFPQRQAKCAICGGKGCGSCEYSGLAGKRSVEGIIAKGLMSATKGQAPKFSWFGSEDQNSLVLGKGRPFYARVFNPKKRRLRKLRIRDGAVRTTISAEYDDLPDIQARFRVKTRIRARSEKTLENQDLNTLKSLAGTDVIFQNRSGSAAKKIYSALVRKLNPNTFVLTIDADGGLMIKQFVGGEQYMTPNLSEILGSRCECITFDILDVAIQSPSTTKHLNALCTS
jgi:tRNA pseudouridine synthase 10